MLRPEQPLAIFMEEHLGLPQGKMGYGILRFSPNPVTCVIDSKHAGKTVAAVMATPRDCPVVTSVTEAAALGAEVLVLGIAPPGGLLPEAWLSEVDKAVACGMSVINGLHNHLAERYADLRAGQFVWDIRKEPAGIGVGNAAARNLQNKRVLIVGTDMACGKMTAGLMLCKCAQEQGIKAAFVATGQIGITICGRGVPLDAVKLDYACGAVQHAVMEVADHDLIVVEGQGSILHPGSSATLPLIRGSCPTHLILCHRAGAETLMRHPWVQVPPLRDLCALYEQIASAVGSLPATRTAAISLNTQLLSEREARDAVAKVSDETGLPTTDAVRFGARPLLDALWNE